MFKSTLSMLLIVSGVAYADESGSMAECKARCWGAPKAAEGIIQGIDDILQQKENKTGAYQKRYDYLKDRLHKTERNTAAMNLLEYDPVSQLPRFAGTLIGKSIAKRTSAEMCFRRCGSSRVRANQPIDFMHEYFITVIVSLGMENLKKAFLYYGTPFDNFNVQKMLDGVAKNMKQEKLDKVLSKAKDNQVVDFVKSVRAGKNSFTKLRPKK